MLNRNTRLKARLDASMRVMLEAARVRFFAALLVVPGVAIASPASGLLAVNPALAVGFVSADKSGGHGHDSHGHEEHEEGGGSVMENHDDGHDGDSHDSHDGHDHGEDGHSHGEDGHGNDESSHSEGADGHDHDHEEGVVELSDEVMAEFGIEVNEVMAGVLHEEVVLPGEIQFNREHVAFVTPRYAGTVLEIKARLADAVSEGDTLAVLESTDTLRPFELKAPFDGVITDYAITQGQTVEAGQSLFTVANLDTVWADLRIYQRDMAKIAKGQRVVILSGHGDVSYRGKISYIAPVIDEHTRTGLARVVVDNGKGDWRPGQFIKGAVSIDEHRADVTVPREAVIEFEGQTVVFVQTDEGYEPRPVVLGHADSQSYAVEGGLEPGERAVMRNAISLKAELGKGSFGGHVH